MDAISKQVDELCRVEYEAAKASHLPVASMHEGYALLKEEIEEAMAEQTEANRRLDSLWLAIRNDWVAPVEYNTASIKHRMLRCAVEAIQAAAVCDRIMDLLEKEEK